MDAVRADAAVLAERRTASRLDDAWHSTDDVVRRAGVAAGATSCLVAMLTPVDGVVRLSCALVGVVLAAAALVDVHERRLPNRLLALGAVIALAGPVLTGDPRMLVRGLVGGMIAGISMLIVRLARGVGMGDVKAAAVLGVSVGTVNLVAAPLAIATAAFAAATYGLLAHRQRIPLGPSLWFGWAAALLVTSLGWWT
jgi:prepilin signal peptidase PulO-like enzyme (type II secretory pathway)